MLLYPNHYPVWCAKVDSGLHKAKANEVGESNSKRRKTDETAETVEMETAASFLEDDNYVDMGVIEEQSKEFPSPSEEEDSETDSEEETEGLNNNSNIRSSVRIASALGSNERSPRTQMPQQLLPERSDGNPVTPSKELMQSLNMMQNFMLKKGMIDKPMDITEMMELAQTEEPVTINRLIEEVNKPNKQVNGGKNPSVNKCKGKIHGKTQYKQPENQIANALNSAEHCESEVTLYKRAVRQVAPNLENQIDSFINNIRNKVGKSAEHRKHSSSSDELMDTSNECESAALIDNNSFVGDAGPSKDGHFNMSAHVEKTAEEQVADSFIWQAEKSKAKLLGVSGTNYFAKEVSNTNEQHNVQAATPFLNVAHMDEDYQMIDSHIEEAIREKITSFEFVDFSKLLVKNKSLRDGDQRMEIVSRNGMTYLSPVSERESVQMSSYAKWETAFRVYSNILTTKYPGKATELLQYNHTIHTASLSYVSDNVYAYDKEFRHHIERHPSRSWSIILQQAWTMLLKDRLKNDNTYFQKGGNHHRGGAKSNKKDSEPCRCFNKGSCTFGLSCKYDHRCSVPKCGKFGHGAHICRLRQSSTEQTKEKHKPNSVGGHAVGQAGHRDLVK